MDHQRFSISKQVKSIKFAMNGMKILISEEHNARIHLLAAICAIAAGFYFTISLSEWMAIIFSIGIVFSLESINSSIEYIADFISPEKHDKIMKIKDVSAAGVLFGAISALIIGLIIFLPKLLT